MEESENQGLIIELANEVGGHSTHLGLKCIDTIELGIWIIIQQL